MSQITLNASMRSNLLSLQDTQSLMDITQERLSTGKQVNSALDNPSAFYTAQSLSNRASDLSSLLDSMGQGIQTIKAANEGIEAITTFVQQAKAIANSAKDEAPKVAVSTGTYDNAAVSNAEFRVTIGETTHTLSVSWAANADDSAITTAVQTQLDTLPDQNGVSPNLKITANGDGTFSLNSQSGVEAEIDFDINGITLKGTVGNDARVKSVDQFNNILSQVDQLAKDSGYKGINLLQENNLTVIFNEDRSSNLDVIGVDASSKGLGLGIAEDWGITAKINKAIEQADSAVNTLRAWSSQFGNNYSVVQTREDFTENLINVLTEGADKLTLADMNEESANMLALQTRQQLAINSLSLASQASQSVLKLF